MSRGPGLFATRIQYRDGTLYLRMNAWREGAVAVAGRFRGHLDPSGTASGTFICDLDVLSRDRDAAFTVVGENLPASSGGLTLLHEFLLAGMEAERLLPEALVRELIAGMRVTAEEDE